MSNARVVTLGGVDYQVTPLTLVEVQQILPLVNQTKNKNIEDILTIAESQAFGSLAQIVVKKANPSMTADQAQSITGVKLAELLICRKICGQMIGLYAEDNEPGEGQGAMPPQSS